MHLTEAATVDGEVLRKCVDLAAVDGAMTGDNPIAWDDVSVHAEVPATVFNEAIHLLEAALVQKHLETLARRHFPAGMLGLNAGLTATDLDFGLAGSEVFQAFLSGRHGLT